jgi:hypothetical protein
LQFHQLDFKLFQLLYIFSQGGEKTADMLLQVAAETHHSGGLFEKSGKFPAWRLFDTVLFKSYNLPALNKTTILFSTKEQNFAGRRAG